jgi:hypothetical protein
MGGKDRGMSHPITTGDGPARIAEPDPGPLFVESPREVTRYAIPPETHKEACRGCGEPIYWITTPAGEPMPVNPDGVSHFYTCPYCFPFLLFLKGPKAPAPEGAVLQMDLKTAVQTLVAFVDNAPVWDREATAAKIILQELKAQGIREKETSAAIFAMIMGLQEAMPDPQEEACSVPEVRFAEVRR